MDRADPRRQVPEPAAFLKIGGEGRPVARDAGKASNWLTDLASAAAEAGLSRLANLCRDEGAFDRGRLGAVLDLSPYLNTVMLRHPQWLDRLFDDDAGARIRAVIDGLCALPESEMTEARLMTVLREAKLEALLLVALRDLFGAADGRRTTADLSDLADAAIGAALRFALLDLGGRGRLKLFDQTRPEEGCGLFVLGMGKLGAGELNYSSDVDLIVLFDPEVSAVLDPDESVETFSRLVRRLVRIIGDRTGDGYVFRTDLRLRPDPGAMPLAIPVPTALAYYEDSGRNWERAAMLKARCVAGDREAAAGFSREIAPFVWRKYLDFNAVAEIQSMKGRIDRHRGFNGIGVAGHNVKLGPGGIREIEFFAQAQQLIAGGRSPELRVRRTEEALRALAKAGWISDETAADMVEAYWFLRRVEHAAQMVADEQTHTLPDDRPGLTGIAGLLGFPDADAFGSALLERLSLVEARFDGLFSGADTDDAGEGRLSLFLDDGDVDGLAAELRTLGFARPEASARILAGWGAGRYRAMRTSAARRHLASMLLDLLRSLAAANDPDGALAAFDSFLGGLPSGLQFFSLLASNPKVLDLLTLIVTSAPRLSATIADRPHVFDALLDPTFFREMPTRDLREARLRGFMADAADYEEELVRLRLFAADQRFLVGTRLLSGAIEGEEAGPAFSDIADVVIAHALSTVEAAFTSRHGFVSGGRIALFGMGRLGSRELTAGSDVDLILFYDHPEEEDESAGGKPLPSSVYYTRLTQRLIAALSAPMSEGVLYDVDFRLRPSGNKGPLATHIDAFRRYQAGEARTWERMALTRSRFLAGDRTFGGEVARTIRTLLGRDVDAETTGIDVASMRALIEREKPARGPLDLKLRSGGVIDLEFLAQWLILTRRAPPEMIGRPTAEILSASRDAVADPLPEAMRALTRVLHIMRLGPENAYETTALPFRLAARIAESLELRRIEDIEPAIEAVAAGVRASFNRLLPPFLAPE